ncbi:App1 family protein [Salinimicrobium terrae]|uniref:App1 family protein n=1 Tax=Salinimicrobium terrae TaxID=470866 RepID=UPI000686AE79|nr:phosphatase domain-containing protein [Salinimicrobium terrae]
MARSRVQLKEKLKNALSRAEELFTEKRISFKKRFDLLEPLKIMPFRGFGNENYVFIKGRVMEEQKISDQPKDQSVAGHLKDTFRRYETDEIPHIKIKASFNGKNIKTKTDSEGYFEVEFRFDEPIDYRKAGKKVQLELLETKSEDDYKTAEGQIFVPGENPEFGVISDIDDTIMISRINHFFEKLKLMLLQDASDRTPFPGIGAFLHALKLGRDGKGNNPVFYVSGSEWNLYDLLVNFMEYHDIPAGPLLLKDKGSGLDKGKLETGDEQYKQQKIKHILDTYPEQKFICIGDSGQEDAEIYQRIEQQYPNRLLAIYIRDVTKDKRDREIKQIKGKVEEGDTEMKLLEETFSAARHALGMGWINKDQLDSIRKSCEEDAKD